MIKYFDVATKNPLVGEFVDPEHNFDDKMQDIYKLNEVDKAPSKWKHKICILGATGAVGR